MDRSLDDAIRERNARDRGNNNRFRGGRDRRPPRDGVQKQRQNERSDGSANDFWQHDKYTDNPDQDAARASPPRFREQPSRRPPREASGFKIKIENLPYELLVEDLRDTFENWGAIREARLVFDKFDRATGVAYVVYYDRRDAEDAVRSANGALALGQVMTVTMITPGNVPNDRPGPEDRPHRSLVDRITRDEPDNGADRSRGSGPSLADRVDRDRPIRSNVDSYRPGRDDRSPIRRGRGGPPSRGTRRPGETRVPRRNERPRKTKEDLDQEMEDYFGQGPDTQGNADGSAANGRANSMANGGFGGSTQPASAGDAYDEMELEIQ